MVILNKARIRCSKVKLEMAKLFPFSNVKAFIFHYCNFNVKERLDYTVTEFDHLISGGCYDLS